MYQQFVFMEGRGSPLASLHGTFNCGRLWLLFSESRL